VVTVKHQEVTEALLWPNLTSKATHHNIRADKLLLLSSSNGISSNLREDTRVAMDTRAKVLSS
jgi:hypothetical protein